MQTGQEPVCSGCVLVGTGYTGRYSGSVPFGQHDDKAEIRQICFCCLNIDAGYARYCYGNIHDRVHDWIY